MKPIRTALRAVVLVGFAAATYLAPPYVDAFLVERVSWPVPILTLIDGDTLEIPGDRVRIVGIDACEKRQPITYPDERGVQDCGREAQLFLARLMIHDRGERQVRCIGRTRDIYGRLLARCFVGDVDVSEAMLSEGKAVARSWSLHMNIVRYSVIEFLAWVEGKGIWKGEFIKPELWRRRRS